MFKRLKESFLELGVIVDVFIQAKFLGLEPVEIEGDVVHVGQQDGDVYVWCEKTDTNKVKQFVKIVATGQEYSGYYLGTVVMPSTLVWHVVEL